MRQKQKKIETVSMSMTGMKTVRIQERKRVNWSDVCIDRGPLGYIYEYKRR